MMDMTQPVSMVFILETIGMILAVVALGIFMVKHAKQTKENR